MNSEILLDPFSDCPTFEVFISDGDEPEWLFTFKNTDISLNPVEVVIERTKPAAALVVVATVVDGPNGKGKFVFAPTDFVAGPGQLCTVFVTNTASSKRNSLFRFYIDVSTDPHP